MSFSLQCCECQLACADLQQLEGHIAAVHLQTQPFRCEEAVCGFVYMPTEHALLQHYSTVHGDDVQVSSTYKATSAQQRQRVFEMMNESLQKSYSQQLPTTGLPTDKDAEKGTVQHSATKEEPTAKQPAKEQEGEKVGESAADGQDASRDIATPRDNSDESGDDQLRIIEATSKNVAAGGTPRMLRFQLEVKELLTHNIAIGKAVEELEKHKDKLSAGTDPYLQYFGWALLRFTTDTTKVLNSWPTSYGRLVTGNEKKVEDLEKSLPFDLYRVIKAALLKRRESSTDHDGSELEFALEVVKLVVRRIATLKQLEKRRKRKKDSVTPSDGDNDGQAGTSKQRSSKRRR